MAIITKLDLAGYPKRREYLFFALLSHKTSNNFCEQLFFVYYYYCLRIEKSKETYLSLLQHPKHAS